MDPVDGGPLTPANRTRECCDQWQLRTGQKHRLHFDYTYSRVCIASVLSHHMSLPYEKSYSQVPAYNLSAR